MASRTKLTDSATLELYRVALENAETQPEISAIMADLGYDSTVIADGKALLTKTRTAYDANKTEDDETSAAYADFSSKKRLASRETIRELRIYKILGASTVI